MKESFKNILKASALSSSNFVQSMYLNEKDDLDEELKGVKFETTITILDENDTPVMVARATSCLEDSKPAEKEEAAAEETVETAAEAQQPAVEAQENKNVHTQAPYEQAGYGAYYPMQYMMPYGMPVNPNAMQFPGAPVPPVAYAAAEAPSEKEQNAFKPAAPVNPVPVNPEPVKDVQPEKEVEDNIETPSAPINEAPLKSVNLPTASENTVSAEREDEPESEPETNAVKNNDQVLSFTAEHTSKPSSESFEDSSDDKKKRIEILLRKYAENN